MADYVEADEARTAPGLRLVLHPVPGPWAEGAKGLFHVKGIPYLRVRQRPGEPNEALVAWTGENNAPQAVWQDEPARSAWTELIFLAERLAPDPPLLPDDPRERARLFGLGFALCGEQGFGWQRRLMMFHEFQSIPLDVLPEDHAARQMVGRMAARYGYSAAAAEAAPRRAAEVLRLFSRQLEAQRAAGHRYLLGSRLSALDIYWATFAALLSPLPPEVCPMQDAMRSQYSVADPLLLEAASPALLEHRDFIYEEYLPLPLDF